MKPFTSDEYAVIADAVPGAGKQCRAILAEHFPPKPLGEDELPNHLIVLDAQGTA